MTIFLQFARHRRTKLGTSPSGAVNYFNKVVSSLSKGEYWLARERWGNLVQGVKKRLELWILLRNERVNFPKRLHGQITASAGVNLE